MRYPNVSIIIPTLNSAKVIKTCLDSISRQKYLGKVEIIVSDGGSTDNTIQIAQKYNCKIVQNPLKTAEAGKAVGVKTSLYSYVALIDSDNILPHSNWLIQMMTPFLNHPDLIGSETMFFSYRSDGGFIERYSALLGANDPFAYFSGKYDRYSYLSDQWTGLKINQKDYGQYIILTLSQPDNIPTIGANGTVFNKEFLLSNLHSDYLFDIDTITQYLLTTHLKVKFAKVKTGIIHTFCESSISKFIRKQQRRISDLFFYQSIRQYSWSVSPFSLTNVLFPLYSFSIIFPLFDSIRGFFRIQDFAWFFHPLACVISSYIYITGTLSDKLKLNKQFNRSQWHQ